MRALRAIISMPRDPDAIEHALEGLVALDAYLIDKYGLPHVQECGAHYQRETKEDWRHALEVMQEGWGDCEDLAAYHAAWCRVNYHEPAKLILRKVNSHTLHALVERADGTIEDPSRWLGM